MNGQPTFLVTGAGGFIGSRLVQLLIDRGATVRALVGAPGQPVKPLPVSVPQATLDLGDPDSRRTLRELVKGVDRVIHLGGPASVAASFDAAADYARVHIGGTLAMLEACREAKVSRLVYISSAEVYGRSGMDRVAESALPQARSPYAAAKAGAEQFARAYVYDFGLQVAVLRPFSIYGPGLSPWSLLGRILRQAREGREIVLADLRPVRDYCYLDDLLEAILRAAHAPLPPFCLLNVGTGVGTSVEQLARLVLELLGRELPLRCDPGQPRPGDSEIHHLVADTSLAEALLGWQAATPLRVGLEATIHRMEVL